MGTGQLIAMVVGFGVFGLLFTAYLATCRMRESIGKRSCGVLASFLLFLAFLVPALFSSSMAYAGEAELILPDLGSVQFLGVSGHNLLVWGLVICVAGALMGLVQFAQLRNLPVHEAMREVSEIIYETCKTYLITQGKFLALLWFFIAIIEVVYFYFLSHFDAFRVFIIVVFSVVGILGSYTVAWFGIRINTYANSRTAFASLGGKPFPTYAIPIKAGISIGMLLICIELVIMLFILLYVPGDYAGPCFIGFAIGESLGAAALRIAGGIFTKIADIGSDLMKIFLKIKEDDIRESWPTARATTRATRSALPRTGSRLTA
jgi:K(+)-stimulated pyrophosphate-energized sodium pump